METDKLESMDLNRAQMEIAEALVMGMKKDMGTPIMRSQDYGRAGCYAKTVEMPDTYYKAHMLYLRDYDTIDKDYYAYFKANGVTDDTAWKMGEIVAKTYDDCGIGALLKKRLKK